MKINIKNLFNKFSQNITAKSYNGFLSGHLPVNSTNWGKDDFLKANEISLYVNRAIAKRAEKVGEIEFILKDSKDKVIENDPILTLLNKPNDIFTGDQFWNLYQKYYDLVGEAYIWIESSTEIFDSKKIKGLHLLIPTRVTPVMGKDGKMEKYEYKTSEKTITYKAEEIIYIFNPNPLQPLRGVSLLKAGVNSIQTETQINTYHSRILENGGKVEGVFKFKTGQLTEQQLKDVKVRYQKEYGSAKKSGLPLFLGGDADYIKTGLTPDELSFLEAKKMTLEDICILTSVPKSILASTIDIKFDNADADRIVFLSDTIRPLLKGLTTALNNSLFQKENKLSFVDPTPENVEKELKEITSGIKNYYMTINEAREKRGLDPVDNGDKILIPFNLTSLENEGKTQDETKGLKKKELKHPNSDPDVREQYGKMQIKRMDAREKIFIKVLNEYFKDQKERLIDQLQPTKTKVFSKKNLLDELLQISLEVKIGKETFIPVLTDLLDRAGVDAKEFAGSSFDFNLSAEMGVWLDDRADIFLNQINDTTFKDLRLQFQESLELGESRDKLVGRVRDTYSNITTARAQTIARTEVHNATQKGTVEGYRQGGLTIKIWVAVLDSSTRDSHISVDGEERPLDVAFSNGLLYPGDPRGSAEEIINCRCVI